MKTFQKYVFYINFKFVILFRCTSKNKKIYPKMLVPKNVQYCTVFWNCSDSQSGILELFRQLERYFGTVPTARVVFWNCSDSQCDILELLRQLEWYFGTVPTARVVFWNCSDSQCGILELFRQLVWYFGIVPTASVVFWNCSCIFVLP